MSALKQKPENYDLHLKNYTFNQGEEHTSIISVGDDYTLKVFDLKDKEVTQTLEIEDEISAILYIKEKTCIVYGINNELKLLDFSPITSSLEDSVYLCGFNTKVQKIIYKNNLIYAISEEEEIHIIYFQELGYGLNKINSGHKGSIKDIYVNEKFLITTGYDGFLIINKIIPNSNSFKFEGKIKISPNSLSNNNNYLSIENFNNEILFVSGESSLRKILLIINKNNPNEDYSSLKIEKDFKINHTQEICFLKVIDKFLFSLDKSGLLKISYIESFENIIEFSSIKLIENVNFDFNKFEISLLDEINIPLSLKNLYYCIGGNSTGNISFGSFCDIEKLWEKSKFSNGNNNLNKNHNEQIENKEGNSMDIMEESKDGEESEDNEKLRKKKEKRNKLKKKNIKKNKDDSFLDDIAEEKGDEEMLEVDEEEEDELNGNNEEDEEEDHDQDQDKDMDKDKLKVKKEKKKKFEADSNADAEDKEILGLSDIEDEDGEFKSPEEIEKSKIIIINYYVRLFQEYFYDYIIIFI
jgi:hypothetical protein